MTEPARPPLARLSWAAAADSGGSARRESDAMEAPRAGSPRQAFRGAAAARGAAALRPREARNAWEFLAVTAREAPEKTAVVSLGSGGETGRVLSYRGLHEQCSAAAMAYSASELEKAPRPLDSATPLDVVRMIPAIPSTPAIKLCTHSMFGSASSAV